jgi:hypothetical protein
MSAICLHDKKITEKFLQAFEKWIERFAEK